MQRQIGIIMEKTPTENLTPSLSGVLIRLGGNIMLGVGQTFEKIIYRVTL
jgi:hypothetical protein